MSNAPNGWPAPVIQETGNKTPTTKRVKPRGYEVLFNGTGVTSSKTRYLRGYGGQYYPPGPGDPDIYRYPAISNVREAPYDLPDPSWAGGLLSAIKGQKVNLAQLLVEYKQTADLFQVYGRRVVRATSALVRRNPYGVLTALLGSDTTKYPRGWRETLRHPTSELARARLAYAFGIKPLVDDMQGSLESMINAYQTRPIISRVYVGVSAQGQGSRQETNVYLDYGSYDVSSVTTATLKRGVTCYIEWLPFSWSTDASRLGFTNIPYLLWEATPWSWFFDYFVNVGEYLENLDSLHNVKRLGIHIKTKQTVATESVWTGRTQWDVNARATRTYNGSSRSFTTEAPSIQVRWQPHLSGGRMLNILSVTRARVPSSFFNVRY